MVLMGEKHPDVPWKPLQEESSKEDAVVLHGGTDLPHVCEKIGWLVSSQGLHGEEEFDTLGISELIAGQQSFLQPVVGQHGVRCHHQMYNLLERLFVQGCCEVAEALRL